jgi:hypothetical protein
MKFDRPYFYFESDDAGVTAQLPRTPFARWGKIRVPFQVCFSLSSTEEGGHVSLSLRILWALFEATIRGFPGLPGIWSFRLVQGLDCVSSRYWWATIARPAEKPNKFADHFAKSMLPAIDDVIFGKFGQERHSGTPIEQFTVGSWDEYARSHRVFEFPEPTEVMHWENEGGASHDA